MGESNYDSIYCWMKDHRTEILDDLKRLVKIPSISDAAAPEKPFGQACKDVLDEYFTIAAEKGFLHENYEYYCGSVWLPEQAGDVQKSIGVWSHLDVVSPGQGWSSDPFTPVEKDGYLIARGVDDNKCAAIGAMYGALCLKELGISLRHPLRLFGGVNEEAGMEDISYYIAHNPCPKLSIVPDSGFPVCYGEKGSMILELTSQEAAGETILDFRGGITLNTVPEHAQAALLGRCSPAKEIDSLTVVQENDRCIIEAKGIAGHIAFPEGSENAIGRLAAYLADSGKLSPPDQRRMEFLRQITNEYTGEALGIAQRDDISGPLTCVGVDICLDEERRYQLKLGIRYPITGSGEEIAAIASRRANQHGFKARVSKDSAPNLYPKDSPIVQAITKIYRQATGGSREPFTMGGGTYARKLPNAFASGLIGGIPDDARAGTFPNGFGGAHQPDEAIKMDNLLVGAAIFAAGLVEADRLLDR